MDDTCASSPPVARPDASADASAEDAGRGWLWGVAGAGYLQASALLLVGLAADLVPSARGVVGLEMVATDTHQPWGVALTALGLVSLLCCLLLLLGHGFALGALVLIGAIGTVGLSVLGSWVALVVPVAMVVGLALVLASPALDQLAPSRPIDGAAA